jgi:hypothetical protein
LGIFAGAKNIIYFFWECWLQMIQFDRKLLFHLSLLALLLDHVCHWNLAMFFLKNDSGQHKLHANNILTGFVTSTYGWLIVCIFVEKWLMVTISTSCITYSVISVKVLNTNPTDINILHS